MLFHFSLRCLRRLPLPEAGIPSDIVNRNPSGSKSYDGYKVVRAKVQFDQF